MAKSINNCMFTGRVGKQPVTKTFGLTEVAEFSLAVSRAYKKNNEWIDETSWLNMKAFGFNATKIIKDVNKGDFIVVTCEFRDGSYIDKSGNKKSFPHFIINSLVLPPKPKNTNIDYTENNNNIPTNDEIPF